MVRDSPSVLVSTQTIVTHARSHVGRHVPLNTQHTCTHAFIHTRPRSSTTFHLALLLLCQLYNNYDQGLQSLLFTLCAAVGMTQGLAKTFVLCEFHMWRLGPRDLPPNLVCFGRAAVIYSCSLC